MRWFGAVWRFADITEDTASDLIPRVIAGCVVPRLVAVIRCGWDVTSGRQTRAVVDAVKDVLQYEPPGDAKQVRRESGGAYTRFR